MSSYIEFQNVTFGYPDDEGNVTNDVIENFNLKIEKGSFVAVLGHNGCGKSTLAKLCNAIEVPLSGKVFVDGLDTADEEKVLDIRRRVGVVFQNPDNQIVATIVEDDVAFGPENLGVDPKEIRERVDEALKNVGMYEFRTFEPHKLSGGQKQRVAIAGIIAMKPECIVLDEPTAMLDPRGRREVMKTVKKLNKEFGITVIFITHYMDEAAKADRVVVMDNGKVVLDDEPRKVFSNDETLKKVGLDVPQATELSKMLVRDGIKIPEDSLDIDELFENIKAVLEAQ
ncbi:MAG: energy-coupling factor transporter ATPase [Clostridia bacterium]|nr:energy-coupling factor transporter ATPase [Clostridia bacterium]